MLPRVAGLIMTMCLVLMGSLASRAEAFIYWTGGAAPGIGRANLDGRGVNENFIVGHGDYGSLAVDSAHIYWSKEGSLSTGAIGRANLDGTGVDEQFITGLRVASDVAVDAAYIYWAAPPLIGRANIDGSNPQPSFIDTGEPSFTIDVDSTSIYWTGGAAPGIGRANLDGSSPTNTFVAGFSGNLKHDDTYIYANTTQGVGRVKLDGSNPEPGFITPLPVGLLGVDRAHVYYGIPSYVGRVNLDGTRNPMFMHIPPPRDIVTDPLTGPTSGGGSAASATLSGAKTQKLGRAIVIGVLCRAAGCGALASATVRVPKAGKSKAKTLRLKRVAKLLVKGHITTIVLKLSARARRAIRYALQHRKLVKASIKIIVADGTGPPKTLRRTIKLKL